MSGPGLGATKQAMAQIGGIDVVGIGVTADIVIVGAWPTGTWVSSVACDRNRLSSDGCHLVTMRGGMRDLLGTLLCFQGSTSVSGSCWSSVMVIGFVRSDPFHRSTHPSHHEQHARCVEDTVNLIGYGSPRLPCPLRVLTLTEN